MPASSLRRTVRAVAGAAALTLAAAAPAAAGPCTIDVVNLGDSYSAAVGTGGVVATEILRPATGQPCVQGTGADHIDKLDERRRVQVLLDASCSGATAPEVGAIALSDRVRPLLGEAELVTLTLGGNDTGWAEYVRACSVPGENTSPGSCDALLGAADERIAAAAAAAGRTVAAIAGQTEGRIVVLGYPHLFDGGQDTGFLTTERAAQLNELTDALNAALAGAAEANGAVFADVADRFAGHGADSAAPWVSFDPQNPGDPNNLHPTERGYRSGYYPALMSVVSPGQLGR